MTQQPTQDDRDRAGNAEIDPDAVNLPPGAKLPDRAMFAKWQHFARGVTALVGLVFLIAFWAVFAREYPKLYAACGGLIALSMGYHFFRFFRPAR
jgi:hypothetical protein